jgi:hypothetical protein
MIESIVRVHGYTRRMNVIEFVKLIRNATGRGLNSTKRDVDDLLAGTPFELAFPSGTVAARFCEDASALGALCGIVPESSVPPDPSTGGS